MGKISISIQQEACTSKFVLRPMLTKIFINNLNEEIEGNSSNIQTEGRLNIQKNLDRLKTLGPILQNSIQ